MIRQGKVVDRMVDETGIFCRVQWLDKQNLVSRPLPVKQHGSRGTSAMYCPKIGDDVSVTMLPNSDGGEGFIDGSFYTTSNPPPITDLDTRHITFADGTVIEYAEGNSTLKVDSRGPISIKCTGVCTIEAAGDMLIKTPKLKIEADVRIDGTLDLEGIIINTHKHTDVEPGGSKSGGPTN